MAKKFFEVKNPVNEIKHIIEYFLAFKMKTKNDKSIARQTNVVYEFNFYSYIYERKKKKKLAYLKYLELCILLHIL